MCVSVNWNCTSLPLGVGAGAGSSIFGFLTQRTQPEERASIFAAIMACRQVGLLVGQPPSFLYLITGRELSFHLPPPPSALVIYRSVRCLLWFAAVPLTPLVFFFFYSFKWTSFCLSRAGVQPVPEAVWFQTGALCCEQVYISWGNCIQIQSLKRYKKPHELKSNL